MKGLVEKEVASGTPANRIVVGGFSQGGAIAVMMLREMKELAGVVGALPNPHTVPFPQPAKNQINSSDIQKCVIEA